MTLTLNNFLCIEQLSDVTLPVIELYLHRMSDQAPGLFEEPPMRQQISFQELERIQEMVFEMGQNSTPSGVFMPGYFVQWKCCVDIDAV